MSNKRKNKSMKIKCTYEVQGILYHPKQLPADLFTLGKNTALV